MTVTVTSALYDLAPSCLLVSLLQVRIREATGLPLNLSNFVFCQYTFWEHGEPTVAPPMVSPDKPSPRSPDAQFTVQFDHCKVSEKEPLVVSI